MINPELLEMLACPDDRTPVHLADDSTVEALNARIRAGGVKNRKGDAVTREIEAGLVRADGKYLYPIWDDIPIMLIDEAIPLS
jgi:uncharacterized protein YbaR (Trm112 family)